MVKSTSSSTARHVVAGPADEAMSELVRFSENVHPLTNLRPTHQIREVAEVKKLLQAGFKPRQIAAALQVKVATVGRWLECGQESLVLDDSTAKSLGWLLKIAQKRREAGYLADATASWWEASLQQLGGQRPAAVFLSSPRRVRDSIKSRLASKRLKTEPRGAKRARWENLPDILGQ